LRGSVVAEFPGERFTKICGVTNLGDVEAVIEAGADGLGLILATSSRRVSIVQAAELAVAAKGRVMVTGVFRDSDDAAVLSALDALALDVVQIHGALGPELLDALRQRGLKVVKALAIGSGEFFDFDETLVDAVLIDGPSPGSGRTHSLGGPLGAQVPGTGDRRGRSDAGQRRRHHSCHGRLGRRHRERRGVRTWREGPYAGEALRRERALGNGATKGVK
jgi:hypothetical protein